MALLPKSNSPKEELPLLEKARKDKAFFLFKLFLLLFFKGALFLFSLNALFYFASKERSGQVLSKKS